MCNINTGKMNLLAAFLCVFLAAGVQGSQRSTYYDGLLSNTPHNHHNPSLGHHATQHQVSPSLKRKSNMYGTGGSDVAAMPRIVGGTEANKHEFPWMVSLRIYFVWELRHSCGGSVINQWWVLTAAHCCRPKAAYLRSIVAGEHNLEKDEGREQKREVEKIIVHPDYNHPTLENDICLLKLAKPLDLDGKTVEPISLPTPLATPTRNCVVMGWGAVGHGIKISNILKKVNATIITDEECQLIYKDCSIPVVDSMICAGYRKGTEGFCKGDSGGSLVCQGPDKQYYQVGVVSWTSSGCTKGKYPGVYTEVSYYIDWINEVIHK